MKLKTNVGVKFAVAVKEPTNVMFLGYSGIPIILMDMLPTMQFT